MKLLTGHPVTCILLVMYYMTSWVQYSTGHVIHYQLGIGHVIHDQLGTGHVFHDQLLPVIGHVLHDLL